METRLLHAFLSMVTNFVGTCEQNKNKNIILQVCRRNYILHTYVYVKLQISSTNSQTNGHDEAISVPF